MTSPKQVRTRVLISLVIVTASMGITFVGLRATEPRSDRIAKINIPETPTETPKEKSVKHVYSLPDRLIIPRLGVDASVLQMGVTASGVMDSPKTNHDTGWYSLGARPGNVGSAVIAGHLGLKNDAVFGKLHQLVKGDTLSVIDDQGSKVSFVVKDVQKYERQSDTTKIFNSQGGAYLNLITCNGDWEASQETYDKRLVVFTERI